MWVCGAWIRIYNVLCSKSYSTLGGLFWTSTGCRQAARGARICETHLLDSVMAWHLIGAKPSSEPMMIIVNWSLGIKIIWKSKWKCLNSLSRKCIEQCYQKVWSCCSGFKELNTDFWGATQSYCMCPLRNQYRTSWLRVFCREHQICGYCERRKPYWSAPQSVWGSWQLCGRKESSRLLAANISYVNLFAPGACFNTKVPICIVTG